MWADPFPMILPELGGPDVVLELGREKEALGAKEGQRMETGKQGLFVGPFVSLFFCVFFFPFFSKYDFLRRCQ